MTESLFRRQAVEYQKDRLHGEVLLLPRISHVLGLAFILCWILAISTWLITGEYANKETVHGWLEPSSGVVKVYADDSSGEMGSVLVNEGDLVIKGQSLLVINAGRTLENGSHVESRLFQELQQQIRILSQRKSRLQLIHQQKMADLRFQIESKEQNLLRLEQQVNAIQQRLSIKQKQLEHHQNMLSQGHITTAALDDLIEHQLSLDSDLQRLIRERIAIFDENKMLQSQLALLPQQHLNNLALIEQEQSEKSQQMIQIESQRSQILRAPARGIVSNLAARPGYKAQTGVPLLTILPEDAQIEANLLVPVRAIGFLKSGQPIEIRYDAFPYQKFGLYAGTVNQIADAVSLPEELRFAPQKPNEPVYLVKAVLSSNSVNAYGKRLGLKSGMTLSADIQLGNRSLTEWILEPLYSLRGTI